MRNVKRKIDVTVVGAILGYCAALGVDNYHQKLNAMLLLGILGVVLGLAYALVAEAFDKRGRLARDSNLGLGARVGAETMAVVGVILEVFVLLTNLPNNPATLNVAVLMETLINVGALILVGIVLGTIIGAISGAIWGSITRFIFSSIWKDEIFI